jgi:DHA1 family bicyclomycin/chloramphenicol resistance-like MFS transporter
VLPNATALALVRHTRNAGTASALLGSLQYLVGAVAGPVVSIGGASTVAMAVGMTVVVLAGSVVWVLVLPRRWPIRPGIATSRIG